MGAIKAAAEQVKSDNNQGLLAGLVTGLLSTVGNLLADILGIIGNLLGTKIGNGCTVDTVLLHVPTTPTSDSSCISKIEDSLPKAPGLENNIGLGLLTDILNTLGAKILSPILTTLGLHISEVDVHLQDLNCGQARLLQ